MSEARARKLQRTVRFMFYAPMILAFIIAVITY